MVSIIFCSFFRSHRNDCLLESFGYWKILAEQKCASLSSKNLPSFARNLLILYRTSFFHPILFDGRLLALERKSLAWKGRGNGRSVILANKSWNERDRIWIIDELSFVRTILPLRNLECWGRKNSRCPNSLYDSRAVKCLRSPRWRNFRGKLIHWEAITLFTGKQKRVNGS